MEIISNNPFRIAGILSNATARELQRNKTRITAHAKVGKNTDSEIDFHFLPRISRKDIEVINKAFSSIQQNQDKVNYALFWFIEDIGIQHLIAGNLEKAVEIWEKVTTDKDVNSKNFSAFNNLGTYKLLSNNNNLLIEGIDAKIKLIDSVYFKDFVNSIVGTANTIDKEDQLEKFVEEVQEYLKKNYTNKELIQILDNCDGLSYHYLSQKLANEPLYKIESQIETTKKKRKADKGNAYKFGIKLFANTKEDLSLLKSLLGTSELKYKAIADQLANEIMQCGIDYFNESQENDSSDNYLESSKELTKLADSIAVGKLTKDRAKDSLATLEEMKDRELNQAIALLNSIKLAYEKAISEIDFQVAKMSMTMSYNQSINYSKVDRMKANCLNWDKVVEIVSDGISINDVEAIQRCSNQSKVSEYKTLVDFLFSKLGPIQINQVKHICFWKDVRTAQAKSTAKKVGSTISSASDGCYIATMAYGDYNHPQVFELRKFRDDYLSKTKIGRSFIKFYYKYSPSLVEKLKNKPTINIIIRRGLDQFIKSIKKQ